MAFRILTSDELELLTEQQRAYYEEELAAYNERVRFVEQIEKIESAEMQPFEPTLKPIPAVRKAPELVFTAPAYAVAENNAPAVSAPQKAVVFQDEVTTALPCPAIAKPIHMPSGSSPETPSASLPLVGIATIPDTTFRKPEHSTAPSFPPHAKVSAPVVCADTKNDTTCQMPTIASVKVPEVNPVSMPIIHGDGSNPTTQITVPQIAGLTFAASDAVCTDIPQLQAASVQAPTVAIHLDANIALPTSSLVNAPKKAYTAPEEICVHSSEATPIKAPCIKLAAPSVSCAQLPETKVVAIPVTSDHSRTISMPAAATSSIPIAPEKPYEAPVLATTLVAAQSISLCAPRIVCDPQQIPEAQIPSPSVGIAPAVNFHPADSTPLHRPHIPTVLAPDMDTDETVKKLRKSIT